MTILRDPVSARVYRWKWWAILLNFSTTIYIFLLLAVVNVPICLLVYFLFQSPKMKDLGAMLLFIALPLFLLSVCGGLYFLLLPLGRFFFSYFKVSDQGIEFRYWPTYGLRCHWNNVARIGQYRSLGIISYDVLYLKKADPIGWQVTMTLRQILGIPMPALITLTGYQGWPGGKLAGELRQYAPHLFTGDEMAKPLQK